MTIQEDSSIKLNKMLINNQETDSETHFVD